MRFVSCFSMCVWIEKDCLVFRPYAHIFCRWPMPTSAAHLWFTALQASTMPCAGFSEKTKSWESRPSCLAEHPSTKITTPKLYPSMVQTKTSFKIYLINCRAHLLGLPVLGLLLLVFLGLGLHGFGLLGLDLLILGPSWTWSSWTQSSKA